MNVLHLKCSSPNFSHPALLTTGGETLTSLTMKRLQWARDHPDVVSVSSTEIKYFPLGEKVTISGKAPAA